MGETTGIEWTDSTWNPLRGCTRVSSGCVNCYAEQVAGRFSDLGQPYHGLAERVLDAKSGKQVSRWTGDAPGHGLADGRGLDWIICGGESGPRARPFRVSWMDAALAQCRGSGTPFFAKQIGAHPIVDDLTGWRAPATLLPDASGYRLKLKDKKGGDWSEWPEELRVREMPEARP